MNVKTDPTTGRSRGFAFLVFSNTETIEKVRPHARRVIFSSYGISIIFGLLSALRDLMIKEFNEHALAATKMLVSNVFMLLADMSTTSSYDESIQSVLLLINTTILDS